MSKTEQYYRDNAEAFFDGTVGVDLATIRDRFVAAVRPGGVILDAGCGSGRDARAFLDAGFQVAAFDASPELAALASTHIGIPVAVQRFEDFAMPGPFDGIWACASLLHVPANGLSGTLGKLVSVLVPGGVLYVSFKRGAGERTAGERVFTDLEPDALADLFTASGLCKVETWLTEDARPTRREQWVNGMARRREVAAPRTHLPTLDEAP